MKLKAWPWTFSLMMFMALGAITAHAQTAAGETIVDQFSKAFLERNPKLKEVWIQEIRSVSWEGTGDYVFVVYAVRPDHNFEGSFEDEQFGIFLVDSRLAEIKKVLDIFPSRRWRDYYVKIDRIEDSTVFIKGQGGYGDAEISEAYEIGAR